MNISSREDVGISTIVTLSRRYHHLYLCNLLLKIVPSPVTEDGAFCDLNQLNNKRNQAQVLWILRFILDNFWDILMMVFEIHPWNSRIENYFLLSSSQVWYAFYDDSNLFPRRKKIKYKLGYLGWGHNPITLRWFCFVVFVV